MKKAKVRDGRIEHVWPWIKTYPDGRKVVKPLPTYHPDAMAKLIDVPDYVTAGMVWDEETKKWAKRKPKPPKPEPVHEAWAMVAESLGMTYEEFKAEALRRRKKAKADALAARKK
jgi:hypothetical protein